ncbi:unnamed protein product [Zymoseptoria tritici ST99CH_1E4]|uniref:Glutathione S-transferase n=1 Tax=Zymoseptoria tritici ST99CH_1E4 TaxID=1276532 RepID=A0A2H1GH48_ZYMTR|nr:unnamed protein product [Zymoseptoria tritici ST99CH_1E4]
MSGAKLHFLQASRCIRAAWQLHELDVTYEFDFAERINGTGPAPPEFKERAKGLGKFPTLEDGSEVFYESGNICEYLCDKYDKQNRLLPAVGDPKRYKVLQWVHASEATFMLHGLAVLYAKWNQKDGDVEKTVAGLSVNICKDLDYLESELGKSSGKFIVGDSLTAADIMMQFSVDFVLVRELGTKGKSWPTVEKWLEQCKSTPSYQEAVKKTGYKL